jgi:hypothetical protein
VKQSLTIRPTPGQVLGAALLLAMLPQAQASRTEALKLSARTAQGRPGGGTTYQRRSPGHPALGKAELAQGLPGQLGSPELAPGGRIVEALVTTL